MFFKAHQEFCVNEYAKFVSVLRGSNLAGSCLRRLKRETGPNKMIGEIGEAFSNV